MEPVVQDMQVIYMGTNETNDNGREKDVNKNKQESK